MMYIMCTYKKKDQHILPGQMHAVYDTTIKYTQPCDSHNITARYDIINTLILNHQKPKNVTYPNG